MTASHSGRRHKACTVQQSLFALDTMYVEADSEVNTLRTSIRPRKPASPQLPGRTPLPGLHFRRDDVPTLARGLYRELPATLPTGQAPRGS